MIDYNVQDIREMLSVEEVFEILEEFGGEPYYQGNNIISRTICHNDPASDASHKLYFYSANRLFHCYSGCTDPSFDIFELVIKISKIQWHREMDLNEAVRWIAYRIGYAGEQVDTDKLEDWEFFKNYEDLKDIKVENNQIILKEFDDSILNNFNYNCKLTPWINDGITQASLDRARIGFYPGGDQITIPHYDKDGRFIGLRGRTMGKEEALLYGKYRPLKICSTQYNHPLGFNLYNLNNSRENIKRTGKAIVFEGEKSCLITSSFLGSENDITVATCGSNLSAYQVQLLIEAGAKSIIVAYDKQWQTIGDEEYKSWIKKLKKINDKYSSMVEISFIFDKNNLLGYKNSPCDRGKEVFLTLYNNRVII